MSLRVVPVNDPVELKALIVRLAGRLGFVRVGVAPAGVSARADRFRRFLALGYHGEMAYLARDPDRRCDARNVLEDPAGEGSVICLAASYAPAAEGADEHIARYARGRDYHRVLRGRCRKFLSQLAEAVPDLRGRICVDTAPILERDLAAAAGIGWIGRNGCLIDSRFGSYLLLAEIVINLALPPDEPAANRCGNCRACLEACPTGAIQADGLVDSRRCISYLTIEHRGSVPDPLRSACGQWVFGCDVCQQVCPFNRGVAGGDAELCGPSALASVRPAEIIRWEWADWDRLTRGSAARRATCEMFLRNAAVAAGNARDPADRPALDRLARHESPIVADAARWALRQGV